MNMLQRCVSVCLCIVLLCGAVATRYSEYRGRWSKQWSDMQMHRFVEQIGNRGSCSYSAYLDCTEKLRQNGCTLKIREYKQEETIDGNRYYYLVLWDEIHKMLVEQGEYTFSGNSVLEVYLFREQQDGVQGKKYYGIVHGRK